MRLSQIIKEHLLTVHFPEKYYLVTGAYENVQPPHDTLYKWLRIVLKSIDVYDAVCYDYFMMHRVIIICMITTPQSRYKYYK